MATFNEHLHLPVTKVDDAGARGRGGAACAGALAGVRGWRGAPAARRACTAAARVPHLARPLPSPRHHHHHRPHAGPPAGADRL